MAIGTFIIVVGAISTPVWIAIGVLLALGAAAAALAAAWFTNFGGIQEKTSSVTAFIMTTWGTMLQWITDLTTGKLGWMSEIWSNTFEAIKTIVEIKLQNLRYLFQAFKYAWNGDWYRFGAELRLIWDNNWRLIVTMVTTAFNNVKVAMVTAVNSIKSWWKGINWSTLGRDIALGIANGVKGMSGYLKSVMTSIAQGMLAAFRGFFKIGSPSKVMEAQFKYLAQGANLGWSNTFQFSPVAIGSQMQAAYSGPATPSAGESNGQIISLLAQLNNKDNSQDNASLIRAFRDAVLLLKD